MEVLAPVAPATDVHAPDLPDRPYRALDSRDQHAELGGQLLGQVSGLGVVHPGLEQRDERQAGRTVERPQAPALRRPEVLVVAEVAAAAVDAALAVPRRLALDRREQRPRSQVAGERERLPLLDGRHSQRARSAGVELLGVSGTRPTMPDAAVRARAHLASAFGRRERIGPCRPPTSSPPDAVAFLTDLQREFGERRRELLARRASGSSGLRTASCRTSCPRPPPSATGDWRVAPFPAEIADRRVEITGPVDRKMVINALNSGAKVFMADFEDANSPTWENCIEGQRNLTDALDRTIELDTGEKRYRLNDEVAVLFVRPRGWHLDERHFEVDGEPISGSLFDFGLYFLRNHGRNGRYFYLPKLESHLEARLWNDVFCLAQDRLGVPRGTIKATVLIETILAAFEMDEILYELREHSAGLNAGRWDYIFSVIKKLGHRPEFVLPDRGDGDDGRAVHALLLRAAREDVPPPRRARDGRHGRVHPLAARPRGERRRAREGARGQGARGVAGLRRHLGRASRPRAGRDGGVRPRARRPAEPDRPAARRRARRRRRPARRRRHARRDHRGRPAQQRLRRHPVPRRLAARHRAPSRSTT